MRKPQGKIKSPVLAVRMRKKLSIRRKINGTSERPRLCLTRSNKNFYLQAVDDETSKTLVSYSTFGKDAKKNIKANRDGAKLVGKEIAEKLKKFGVKSVVFDRSGHKYGLVVSTLVDSVRENGIQV